MNTKIRILHIDDNLHDRQLVKDVLQLETDGFEVVEADNREKFGKCLEEQNFDIVLSDFNILGFDGLQVLQVVKEKDPDIPVIIVTGTGSEEIAIQAMKMGAADYVIKSYKHIQGLIPRIKAVLEFKKIQDERKSALIALHESEELFRTAFESAVIGVCMVNQDGRFMSVNKTLVNMLGYTLEELGQVTLNSITHPDDITIGDEILAQLISGESNRAIFEKRYIHKQGHVVWLNISTGIVRKQHDNLKYFVSYIQDITERKKSEEELIIAKEKAEESDRLKTAFLHNISHEIRTPMNSIVGFSGFLNEPGLMPEKRSEFAEIIIQSSNQLLSIITDIINIATIEAGQVKIKESELNLNAKMKYLYDEFSPKAQKQNISLSYKTNLSDPDSTIITDGTKLTDVLLNLIGNSIKFTKKGYVNFDYHVKDNHLEFCVEDTGIGIPIELQGEIFKRFRQVEDTATREFGGSGLGLSISKAYVELLGGNMWLTSEPEKGSKFYFTIPYKKSLRKNGPSDSSLS